MKSEQVSVHNSVGCAYYVRNFDVGEIKAMTEKKKNTLGIIGCIVSFIALAIAFVYPFIASKIDPPSKPVEVKVADMAVRIKEATIAKLKGEEYVVEQESEEKKPSQLLFAGTIFIGVAGSGLGLGSFLREEKRSVSYMAMGMGVASIVFLWSLVIAAAILFIVLVGTVLGGLG